MKKIVFIGVILVAIISASWMLIQSDFDALAELRPTELKFEQKEIDLGLLEQGKPQSATFTFTNTGNNLLVISNAEASCGCTTPEWPKHPIKSGKKGEIKITYDAKYPGRFMKTVKLFCNTEGGIVELVIKGEVSSKE